MAQSIVVKTEVQPNGDILLFYVDEHNADPGILNSNLPDEHILPHSYMVEDFVDEDSPDEYAIAQATELVARERWQEEDIKRLITFFIDNKETFLSGTTRKIHLWVVACKTMLTDKKPISCEAKLNTLKKKYAQLCIDKLKGINITWPFFDLCHQAFFDDNYVRMCLNDASQTPVVVNLPTQNVVNQDGVVFVKKVNTDQTKDEKVEEMLKLYLKYKKMYQKNHNMPRGMWDTIATELGQESAEYWQKRFLNYKQHYIRMIHKRNEVGEEGINWPYISYFDQIYGDDMDFQKKFFQDDSKPDADVVIENLHNIWNDLEKTFLVKYYFDCFNEYQDPTIPKKFLWKEVGRLIDKLPDMCKQKYEELKSAHFDKLLKGEYNLLERLPIDILFDNIIAKEVEIEIEKYCDKPITWTLDEIDEFVQYLYNNCDMVKDSVCYFVCWAVLAKKFQKSIHSCKTQWDELTSLYKSVLNDKKEYPDMQLTWRYIDLFDRIFDYGMDSNLFHGYKKNEDKTLVDKPLKLGAKRITIKSENELENRQSSEDEESYDDRGFTKRTKKGNGDAKAFKILEYHLKNKEKFASSQYKKLALWEVLAKQIGVSAAECAHRFRNFKQVYTGYVQREINKPEKPIIWPYYSLCKKVFGYRAIKTKLKHGKMDSDDAEDWTAKEIKQLINYFARYYCLFIDDVEDKTKWTDLAKELGRSPLCCCEKFLELRKSYRKLKTMKTRRPDVKVSWKYFNMMDEIYKKGAQDVEILEDMEVENGYDCDLPQEDDYQCIIVMPDGEDVDNTQILIQNDNQMNEFDDIKIKTEYKQIVTKWNRRSKTKLLSLYLKYLKSHEEINTREMWTMIASQMEEKTPISCKKMYLKLKLLLNEDKRTPYHNLLEKILAIKPEFKKASKNQDLDSIKIFKDVQIDDEKVHKALRYYLLNLEDFISPKFEKKYLWTELAKYISEPVVKVFHKINYLKETFNGDLYTPFKETLHDIINKENALKDAIMNDLPTLDEEDTTETWSDLEIERLLTWYLAHLDKFKNPKFVRSYLWMEASDILKKSPLVCSKKMLEIRSQYRTMVKESPEELDNWKFYNLCQRIYGTGKKSLNG
ncbi:uncharacterized protein LOC112058323 [Bicyclus anynana]|uniref:Uncharacterized protein LOC112058323 n=1 Tax=Bicyclus anynana TaxID=110368 RepID=A0A6J1PAI9_BICAN|nr:uncharacterized protein LOC112058323 [Bicyclus anynana]XP_052745198.1 uncharacterized protein LOC112058323 [Bicyclus anynana]